MIPLLGTAFRAGMLAAFLLLMTVAFTACGGDGVQSGTESNEGDPRITEVRTAVAGSGGATNGSATSEHSAEPATTVAVSSSASPPPADLMSAFHDACSRPAPRTASVTPSVSSTGGSPR